MSLLHTASWSQTISNLLWFLAALALGASTYFIGYSDGSKVKGRMQAFVDPMTGCQYVATSDSGALFPRMDRKFQQICGQTTTNEN